MVLGVEGEGLGWLVGEVGGGGLAEAGVVEGDAEGAGDGGGEWVVEAGHALVGAGGVGVEDAVPIAAVGAAEVDDGAVVEDGAMLFVEGDPAGDEFFGFWGVVEARAAVAGLDAVA